MFGFFFVSHAYGLNASHFMEEKKLRGVTVFTFFFSSMYAGFEELTISIPNGSVHLDPSTNFWAFIGSGII